MPGPAWDDDPAGSLPQIQTNLRELLRAMVASAPSRPTPGLGLAFSWHTTLYGGVAVPSPSYLGNPRDSDPAHPDLIGYEVLVGARQGLPSAQVPAALAAFTTAMTSAVAAFDDIIGPGAPPSDQPQLMAVLELAATAHGEWIRIHPFANGNGRTARLWAVWVATRYGLPPFIQVKPRPPGLLYARAAEASMGVAPDFSGNHSPMAAVFLDMLMQPPAP